MSIRHENTIEVRTPESTPVFTWSDNVNTCGFYFTDGSPEGSVTASPGSLASDFTNSLLYRKATGAANTGWELVNTNFLNADLESTGSRTHLLNNNFFSIKGNTTFANGSQINVNGSLIYLQGGTEYLTGNITLDTGGIDLQMIGATDLRLNDDPGTAGQVVTSAGPGLPAVWGDATDTSITSGSLATATTNRTVDLDTYDLTFDNLQTVRFNGNGLSEFDFDTTIFSISNPSDGVGGRLTLLDGDDNRSVSIQSPVTIPTAYTLTLPSAPPASNGQVLTFTTAGVASFANAAADTNFQNTPLTFTTNREHYVDGNQLTIMGNTSFNDGAYLQWNGTQINIGGGVVTGSNFCNLAVDQNGFNLGFNGVADLRLDNDAGTSGQVLQSNGPDTAPSWETITVESRKYDADNLGNISIAAPFNFDAGSYDNKIVNVTGNVNIITLSSTRSGYYSIRFASAGGPYNLAWGGITFFGSTPPSSIDTEEFLVELFYDSVSDVWHYLEGSNFFSKDFTATENRFHHLANNGLFMRGGTSTLDGSLFTMNGELLYMLGGISGSNSGSITLNAGGIQLDFGGSGDFKLASDPGTNGQVLTSNGPDVAPTWEDAGGSSPNITTGTLLAAVDNRTVDLGTNDLTFDSLNDVTFSGSSLSVFTFDGNVTSFSNPGASGGKIALLDGDANRSVGIQCPTTVPTTYVITLPTAPPASNGQLLSFTTAGVASFIDAPSGDHLFTQPLQNTYGDISHDANTHDFGITNIGTLDFQAEEFGISTDSGSAWSIDSAGVVTLGKYAAGAQDGTPTRSLGIDATGTVVSYEYTPSEPIVARIRVDAAIPAGTSLDLVTGVDGDGTNHTVIPVGAVGTPTLADLPTQDAFAADPDTEVYFEGVACDKSGYSTANGVTRVSDTAISFTWDVPEDSIIYFKRKV